MARTTRDLRDYVAAVVGSAVLGTALPTGVLIYAGYVMNRHCPLHPPSGCGIGDVWFYAFWLGSTTWLGAVGGCWLGLRAVGASDAARTAKVLAVLAPLGPVVLFALLLDVKLSATAYLAATLVACAVAARRFVLWKGDRRFVTVTRS